MKTVVLKIRVTPEQRDRWKRVSEKRGAISLSDFIRDLVDEEIKWEPASPEDAAAVAAVLGEGRLVVSHTPPLAGVAELADAPDSNPGEETREGSTPSPGTSCPRRFTHKPGVYCKACGKTP